MHPLAVSSIRKFWSRLEKSIHPDDGAIFAASDHPSFHLKFPPPAFIGAVDTAPIVILMAHGGYHPGETEAEFPDEAAVAEQRDFLTGETSKLPCALSRYYVEGPFWDWIENGDAVIVNAVAYRYAKLEKYEQNLVKRLPSLKAHRRWLSQEVLPAAAQDRRFVLAHQYGLWDISKTPERSCVIFSDPQRAEPNRSAPDREKLQIAQNWLDRYKNHAYQ